MKVVVLGGGIAGLCIGIYLQQNHIEVSVNERQIYSAVGGHAFLMHHDGISVLKEVAGDTDCMIPGKPVDTFVFRKPDGELVMELELDDWHCFKRTDLLNCLTSLFPSQYLHNERVFSHFIYKQDKIVAAAFKNGDIEYGDIFVGADGANSVVRREIFGHIEFMPGKVKEMVGIVNYPALARSTKGRFTKFQYGHQGLSCGFIATSDTELVWFMQYDPLMADIKEGSDTRTSNNYPELLRDLCATLLKDFPPEVQEILALNDFTTSYIWNTRDFDLLPSFHSRNVVLIGDAAHVALPFTSAGTTNAMMDAKVLCECLQLFPDIDKAFDEYYQLRAMNVAEHIKLGRNLRDAFLDPLASARVPLISNTADLD